MNVTGIILSGGKSSRMGQDKGLMELKGKPMIQYVIDQLSPVCRQILIGANHGEYKKFGYPVVQDIIKDIGPAGGIISCLRHSLHHKNMVLACDLPFISSEFLIRLLELSSNYDITVPDTGHSIQPLCGIYDICIQEKLKILVGQGEYSMRRLLRHFSINVVRQEQVPDIDFNQVLLNINTRNDLGQYQD
jgi:molybdopterin-guanine dinucleotide biosynthesis protein A